jgi:hypothetical protein
MITRTLSRRLSRLEETLGAGPETELQKYLRQRLDAARKRMERWGYKIGPMPPEELASLTTTEILHRGRERAFGRIGPPLLASETNNLSDKDLEGYPVKKGPR